MTSLHKFAGTLLAILLAFPCVAEYRVGVATVDITPDGASLNAGEIYMGGYGLWKDRGPATGVHDPLSSRALCIRAEIGLCIVIVDSLGIPGPVNKEIAVRASEQTGVDANHILIGATHTHAAPDLLGLWGGSTKAYVRHFIEQTTRAIVAAVDASEPAHLYFSVTKGKAHNRRGWQFTDDEIVVLQAVARDTNRTIGTLINFAAHPVISPKENLLISSDVVHYLRKTSEALTGAPVIYVSGAIGDVTPMAERGDDYWKDARTYGESIANQSIASLAKRQSVDVGIDIQRHEFVSDVDNLVLALAQVSGIVEDHSTGPIWNVKVESSVARFSLGRQVNAVAVPGEALTRLGLKIKHDMTAPARLFLGLNGGSLGYFVPADEWKTGRNNNYEESVSLGKHVAGQIEELLREPWPRSVPAD